MRPSPSPRARSLGRNGSPRARIGLESVVLSSARNLSFSLTELPPTRVLVDYMASNEADETLQAARAGDSTALDRLWTEHRRWIAVVLLAHMPREAEVEDMLQDVALKLVRGVSEVEDPATLRPWLRSVALNTARSAGRKASLRRRILRRLDPDDLQIADPGSERGMRALEAKWAAQRALDASRDLAPEYREPLLLRVLEGLSQRAIADFVPQKTPRASSAAGTAASRLPRIGWVSSSLIQSTSSQDRSGCHHSVAKPPSGRPIP